MTEGDGGRASRLLESWIGLVRRFRVPVLLLAGLAAAASIRVAATGLEISTDTESLFSRDLPWRTAMDHYQEAFPHAGHTILVVIDGPSSGVAARSQERLTRRLAREDSLFASVYAPRGGAYFERYGLMLRSPEQLRTIASRVEEYAGLLSRLERSPTLPTFAAVLDSTLEAQPQAGGLDLRPVFGLLVDAFTVENRQPASWSRLFRPSPSSGEGGRRFVVARPHSDRGLIASGGRAIQAVREAVRQLGLERQPGTSVRLTGRVPMRYEELRSARQGAQLAGALALLLVAVVLYFGLRSWRLILSALLTLAVGLAGTAGFAAVAVGRLNLISVAFAVLYVGLGIDYAIHLGLRYREVRIGGRTHGEALTTAGRDVGPSLVLSAATTALAFFSFAATDFVGLSELGIISGGGMFVSLVVTLTVFPALLDLAPPTDARETGPDVVSGALDALAAAPERHGRALAWTFVALSAAGMLLLPAARFDPNPLRLRDPATESVSTYVQLLRSDVQSPLTVTLLRPTAEAAREAAARADELPVVGAARTVDDFVPRRQGEKLPILARIRSGLGPPPPGDGPPPTGVEEALGAVDRIQGDLADYRPRASEGERGVLSFALLQTQRWEGMVSLWEGSDRALFVRILERNLLGRLPSAVRDLRRSLPRDSVALGDLPSELRRRWASPAGEHRVELIPEENLAEPEALERFVSGVRSRFPDATGASVVQYEAGEVAVRAFRTALLIAAAGTLLVLLAALRGIRPAAQVALPLAVAGLITVGASVALGTPFNFANIITLPLLLGVGVDNGIHMVHRHRIQRRGEGILGTSTARAVLVSFLTTILSFGNLALSPHRGMATMGRLLAIGMAAVLATTLLLLPLLLRWSSRSSRGGAPESGEEET